MSMMNWFGGMAPQQQQGSQASPFQAALGFMASPGGQNYLSMQGRANSPVGMPLMTDALYGASGAMQGALGQMAGINSANAANSAAAQQRDMQAQLLREGRHDQNQKWTMLYDALLKPQMFTTMNPFGQVDNREMSPLVHALMQMAQPQSYGSVGQYGASGYGGGFGGFSTPNAFGIPTVYG
jgi:hypothetical protein